MDIHCRYDELISVTKLKPYPKNRNTHTPEQITRLAQLIREHGMRAPIVVAKAPYNCIAKGHGTLEACRELKEKKVPVVFQEFASEEQLYAYVQSDNAIQAWSDLDIKGITADWSNEFRLTLDPDLLGIKDFKVPKLEGAENNEDEEIPEPPKQPRSKLGDLYLLGEHRLLCGDSTDSNCVGELLGNNRAGLIFTDPPYNLASDSKLLAARGLRDSYDKLKESDWDHNFSFERTFPIFEHVLSPDSSIYICTSHFLFGCIQEWLGEWADISNYVVWAKPNPMPSLTKRHWTWSTELIAYGTRGKHTFNFPDKGHALNVWTVQKNAKNDLHPTMKPVEIPERAILHSSHKGDIVVDLFLGSGSTLIAAEQTGRRCFGMEIDPCYVDVILDRWQKFTGKEPVRDDGKKWSEIKNEKNSSDS